MHHKRILLFYGASLFVALLIRTMQLLFVIEPDTGFFYREYQTVGQWMTVFLIAALFFTAFLACFHRRRPSGPPVPNRLLGVVSILSGLTMVYEVLFSDFSRLLSGATLTVELILAVLAATALIWYGMTAFLKVQFQPNVLLLPVLFAFVRLAIAFASYTSLSNIADNLYDTAMMCAVLLLFLYVAKVSAGVDFARSAARLLPIALLASQLCFLCAIPPAIATLLRGSPLKHGTTTAFLADFMLGLFALCYVLELYRKSNEAPLQNVPEVEGTDEMGETRS